MRAGRIHTGAHHGRTQMLYEKPSSLDSSNTAIMEIQPPLFACQAFEHDLHHAQVHPRHTGGRPKFIALTHSSASSHQSKLAFNDPAPG